MGGDDADIRERWLAGVERARQLGYAVDVDGLEAGLTSLAVAVPSTVRGLAVGLAGPSARLTAKRVPAVVPLIRRAATTITSFTE